jgi:RND family efflux transporter MFP subunit
MRDMSEDIVITRRHLKIGAMAGVALVAVILIGGMATRLQAHNDLKARVADLAVPTVSIVHPVQSQSGRRLSLPGALEAWAQAPVYARTSGYLKRWSADIGSVVKEGQVLGEIDAPELDQQLAAAEANLATADANRQLANTTAQRWQKLVAQDAVSRQEADEKFGDLAARTAMANAARAEVDRLRALEGFKRIVAPFDGVVTSRSTDIGALIASGNGSARPLFTVADMRKMRVYVRVPQSYSTSVRNGMKVALTVPEYLGREFAAEMVRSADAVNDQSGTMLIQLAADNADGVLKSGAYASVNFTLDTPANVVRVPASVLMFRKEGPMVATVEGDHVVVKPVTIVQDLGADVDIGVGLGVTDAVIDNPSEIVATGDKVRILEAKAKDNAAS